MRQLTHTTHGALERGERSEVRTFSFSGGAPALLIHHASARVRMRFLLLLSNYDHHTLDGEATLLDPGHVL